FAGPCLRCLFQCGILERFGWIAGDRVEAPGELTGGCVERCKETAHRIFGAADADDHFAFRDTRSHRAGVVLLRVPDPAFPNGFSGFRIESLEPTVDDGRD